MDFKKVASFSLLAYINDNNIGVNKFEDIFVPIVKSSLCKMESDGLQQGKSIIEIKKYVDNAYALDIPIPFLKTLLKTISDEMNCDGENELILYQDGSFQVKSFTFSNYEDILIEREMELEEVNKLYETYLKTNDISIETQPSIFEYIDGSRISLSKYFAHKEDKLLEIEFIHQANFINSVKLNKKIYEILRRVYLGSIMSAYLEVEIGAATEKLELLLDTNFIIGVLDLNSEESTHTCRKILEICARLGYIVSILPYTIEETVMLLDRKATQLEGAFFQGYLDPESIYNAAKRKGLSKTQLQQISSNLEQILTTEYNINIIASDDKYRNLAKFKYNDVFDFYKGIRKTAGFSAHHDTTAIAYVKEKRGITAIYENVFKAKCWFVTNTRHNIAIPDNKKGLPDIIRADDMLNLLWLSNPNVTSLVKSSDLSVLGLTRLVSTTISDSLPSTRVLKLLDENFTKYGGTEITADDTLMVASMIAKKKIPDPDELNKMAVNNPNSFIESVKLYAEQGREEEKELTAKLINVFTTFEAVVKLKQQEKAEKDNTVTETEARLEETIANLVKRNNALRNTFIISSIIGLSLLWWSFDHIIVVPSFAGLKNYIFVKIAVQGLLLTITLAIFTEKYRAAWITGTITLTVAVIMLLKI